MTFKQDDWEARRRGLDRARELIDTYRSDRTRRELLDEAIWSIWRFGEYAVNALLELAGLPTDRGHDLGNSIEVLKLQGWVAGDYRTILEQLERYRKKADYGSYARKTTDHYNATNADDCLEVMLALAEEAEEKLREKGKLS